MTKIFNLCFCIIMKIKVKFYDFEVKDEIEEKNKIMVIIQHPFKKALNQQSLKIILKLLNIHLRGAEMINKL